MNGSVAILSPNGTISGATINGDVFLGEGNNVLNLRSDVIGGTIYTFQQQMSAPIATPPPGYANYGTSLIVNGATTLSSGGIYSDIEFSNHSTLNIIGDVTLIITGDVGSASASLCGITIAANSSLSLYVGGNFVFDNDAVFRTQNASAASMAIIGTSVSGQDFYFHDSAQFSGIIYAPNANINMGNNCTFTGSLVANSIMGKNNCIFNYDSTVPEPATLMMLGLGGILAYAGKCTNRFYKN
jgi:hypothetical protein